LQCIGIRQQTPSDRDETDIDYRTIHKCEA
jgi:hypothetical protein